MSSVKKYIIFILLSFSSNVFSLNLDFGATLGERSLDNANSAYGFNIDLLFGKRGSQFGIGSTKALEKRKDNDLYQSLEALDVFYRFNNLSIGGFFGGVVYDVEDFFDSWNFNDINYQYGYNVELFFNLFNRWNLGIEMRRHIWSKESSGDDYNSYWINLNYLFSI